MLIIFITGNFNTKFKGSSIPIVKRTIFRRQRKKRHLLHI